MPVCQLDTGAAFKEQCATSEVVAPVMVIPVCAWLAPAAMAVKDNARSELGWRTWRYHDLTLRSCGTSSCRRIDLRSEISSRTRDDRVWVVHFRSDNGLSQCGRQQRNQPDQQNRENFLHGSNSFNRCLLFWTRRM